jgi:hypothetical protein
VNNQSQKKDAPAEPRRVFSRTQIWVQWMLAGVA